MDLAGDPVGNQCSLLVCYVRHFYKIVSTSRHVKHFTVDDYVMFLRHKLVAVYECLVFEDKAHKLYRNVDKQLSI